MAETHHYKNDQVVLYHREKSKKWQFRVKVPGTNRWKYYSSGTRELEKAVEIACEKYDEMRILAKHDLSPLPKSIKPVAESVVQVMEAELKAGTGKPTFKTYIQNIRKYIIPFFGSRNFDALDQKAILEFQDFCKKVRGKEPSRPHVNHINTSLRRIFDEAIKKGYIHPSKLPRLKNYGDIGKRRPTFEPEEILNIGFFFEDWCKEPASNHRNREIRKLIWCFSFFSVLTGMRPGTELKELKWGDVDPYWSHNENTYVKIRVRKGKTHKTTGAREVIARPEIVWFIERLREINPNQKPDDYVFRLPDGTYPRHPNTIFRQVLRAMNMEYENGEKRSLYSLRHYYITQQILAGVDIHIIARQCGTSTAMIEKHYSHIISTLVADKLTSEWEEQIVMPEETGKLEMLMRPYKQNGDVLPAPKS